MPCCGLKGKGKPSERLVARVREDLVWLGDGHGVAPLARGPSLQLGDALVERIHVLAEYDGN